MAEDLPEASGDRVAGEGQSEPTVVRLARKGKHNRLVTANRLAQRDDRKMGLPVVASADLAHLEEVLEALGLQAEDAAVRAA